MNEYLTPDDIASTIHVDVSTVRRWLREGQMKYTKFGRAVRVKTKDFEAYCRGREIS